MKYYYLFLESMARIEELLTCILGLATDERITEFRQGRAEEFRQTWLDKQEVLQLLKIGERTLFNLRKQEKLPSRIIGGKMYFHIHDVEKLMERGDKNKR